MHRVGRKTQLDKNAVYTNNEIGHKDKHGRIKSGGQVSNGVLSRYYRDASSTLQRLKKSLSTTSVKFKAIPTVLNGTATKLAKKALQLNAKKIVREPTEEVLSKIILGGSTFVVRSKHGNSA